MSSFQFNSRTVKSSKYYYLSVHCIETAALGDMSGSRSSNPPPDGCMLTELSFHSLKERVKCVARLMPRGFYRKASYDGVRSSGALILIQSISEGYCLLYLG